VVNSQVDDVASFDLYLLYEMR